MSFLTTREPVLELALSATDANAGKLFSSAVRWVGSTAVVPLRWIFSNKFSSGDSADCQVQGDTAGN